MPKIPPRKLPDKSIRLSDGRYAEDVFEEYFQKGLIDRETYEMFLTLRSDFRGAAQDILDDVWDRFNAELGLPPIGQDDEPPLAQ